jgi:hypothetical protein
MEAFKKIIEKLNIFVYGQDNLSIKIPFIYSCSYIDCNNYKIYSSKEAEDLNFICETSPRHKLIKL